MKPLSKYSAAGFTIMEMIIIMVIIGILAAIAAPSWLSFLNRQRLSAAQTQAVGVIRDAQSKARQQKRAWAACFQDDGTKILWAVNPIPANDASGWNCDKATNWSSLIESSTKNIGIDTALSQSPDSASTGQYYGVRFQQNGWVDRVQTDFTSGLGRVTFGLRGQSGGSKRCVDVATLLGAIRTANDDECKNK